MDQRTLAPYTTQMKNTINNIAERAVSKGRRDNVWQCISRGQYLSRKLTRKYLSFRCSAGQQWQRIRAILDRVRTAPVEPTVHMYNIAMDTYKGAIKRGAAEGSGPAAQLRVASAACLPAPTCETVMDLLKEMGDVGVTPDIYSYNIAITANMFAGRWKPIMALLNVWRGIARGRMSLLLFKSVYPVQL